MPKVLPFSREAHFSPSTVNREQRTIEVVWSTGARVLRSRLFSEPFYEELSLDPAHVDLSRFNAGAALCDNHNTLGSIRFQFGVIERAWLENGEGRAIIRFSSREDVIPIFNDVAEGIIRNLSIGYRIYEAVEEQRSGDEYKTIRAIRWEPYELSLVCVPADAKAQTRAQEETNDLTIRSIKAMPSSTIQTEAPNQKTRIQEILKIARTHDLGNDWADSLIAEDIPIDAAKSRALEALETRSKSYQSVGVSVTRDEKETKVEGMVNALLNRSNSSNVLNDNGRRFRSYSLVDVARECVGPGNYTTKDELISRAFHSTSDFPIILGETAKQTLLSSYESLMKKQNHWPLCRVTSVGDFRPAKRVRVGELPGLLPLPEGSEYVAGTFGEAQEEIKVVRWGRKMAITPQILVNDDLAAITNTLGSWGGAVARLESKLFWAVFNDNPLLSDKKPLFDLSHNNLATNAKLDIDSLSNARIAMGRQQGIDKREQGDVRGDYLNLNPEYLIVPPELQTLAQQFLSNEVIPQDPSKVNPFKGAYRLIVSSWLTNPSRWYLSTGVDQGVDVIEMVYLDNQRQPLVDYKVSWETDALQVKCRFDVSCHPIDYRGLYRADIGKGGN